MFDFFQVIVGCPAKDNLQMLGAFLILFLIWFIAVVCATPLFIYRSLIHYNFNITSLDFKHKISYCVEEWPELPFLDGRVYYSVFSLALQYFIPIMVVSSAYMKIYFRLKKRFVITQNIPSVDDRLQNRRGRRMKRTNCLLISIALIFGISWLPLNFFNLYADLNEPKMTQNVYIIYAACHMCGMSSGGRKHTQFHLCFLISLDFHLNALFSISISISHDTTASSACSNPLLYGWLNDNFRKEFNEILCCGKYNHSSTPSVLRLKAIDASCVAAKKRALSEVSDIDKQSKLLLRPHNKHDDMTDLKSEFTM